MSCAQEVSVLMGSSHMAPPVPPKGGRGHDITIQSHLPAQDPYTLCTVCQLSCAVWCVWAVSNLHHQTSTPSSHWQNFSKYGFLGSSWKQAAGRLPSVPLPSHLRARSPSNTHTTLLICRGPRAPADRLQGRKAGVLRVCGYQNPGKQALPWCG